MKRIPNALCSPVFTNRVAEEQGLGLEPRGRADRRVRADAQRNIDTLLHSAMTVFASSGVDAPVREIAEKAGVDPDDLLRAVASLSMPAHDGDPTHARRMVALLVDGLRYGASLSGRKSKKTLNPRPHHSKLDAGRSMTGTRKNMPPGNTES
jgi:hypothetical protein